jgi:hypothetical protein
MQSRVVNSLSRSINRSNEPPCFTAWRLFCSRRKRSRFFEIARVLVRLDHVAPELGGSLRRGRLTSSPPQFGQTKYICSAQLAQYVHS